VAAQRQTGRRSVPPWAEIEEQIDRLLAVGAGDDSRGALSELAGLGQRPPWRRSSTPGSGGARRLRRPDAPPGNRVACSVHRLRNLLAELPKRERDRVRAAYWQALEEANDERDGARRLRAAWPTPSRRSVLHLRYPLRHRRRWRSTNLLERSLGEVKGRTKVIGRFPGEQSCLSPVWAVLDLVISHAANGVRFGEVATRAGRIGQTRLLGPAPEATLSPWGSRGPPLKVRSLSSSDLAIALPPRAERRPKMSG
jgi:Transposase, Mutator family